MSIQNRGEAIFSGELTMTADERMHELEEKFQELAMMQKTLMVKVSETNDQMLLVLAALLERVKKEGEPDGKSS